MRGVAPGPVKDLLSEIAMEVKGLETGIRGALAPVLYEAQKEVQQDLTRWLAVVKNGKERFTAQQYRNALIQLKRSLSAVKKIEPEMYDLLRKKGLKASTLAYTHLARELGEFSNIFGSSLIPIPIRAAGEILSGRAVMTRFKTSAARYAGAVGDDIRRQLALGLVRHETIHQLTNRLQRLGGPRGKVFIRGMEGQRGAVAEQISEGLFKRYRHWGERLARTEVINAYNVASLESIEEAAEHAPELKLRWDAALDARVCPWCRELDDVVIPRGGTFPGGVKAPPLHPQCRCAVVAWHEDWTEAAYRDARTGAKVIRPPVRRP